MPLLISGVVAVGCLALFLKLNGTSHRAWGELVGSILLLLVGLVQFGFFLGESRYRGGMMDTAAAEEYFRGENQLARILVHRLERDRQLAVTRRYDKSQVQITSLDITALDGTHYNISKGRLVKTLNGRRQEFEVRGDGFFPIE